MHALTSVITTRTLGKAPEVKSTKCYFGDMQNTALQAQLLELTRSIGVAEAARKLGLNPHTLTRLCAGLPVRQGTQLAAERALALASVPHFGETAKP